MRARSFILLMALTASMGACKRNSSSISESVGADTSIYEGVSLNAQQERGRRIWYEACGDNGRFHTTSPRSASGAPENWYKVLGSATRDNAGAITDDPRPRLSTGQRRQLRL